MLLIVTDGDLGLYYLLATTCKLVAEVESFISAVPLAHMHRK